MKRLFCFIIFVFFLTSAYAQQWDWAHDTYGLNLDTAQCRFIANDTMGIFYSSGYTNVFRDKNGQVGANMFWVQFIKQSVGSVLRLDSIYIPFYVEKGADSGLISPQFGFFSKAANTNITFAGRDKSRNYAAEGFMGNDQGWHVMIYYGFNPATLPIKSFDEEILNMVMHPFQDDTLVHHISTVIGIGTATFFYTSQSGADSVVSESSKVTGIASFPITPSDFHLYQNYPNPFNPSTRIAYDVAKSGDVKLSVFNTLGQEVSTLVDGYQSAGHHTVSFDASRLASGTYFYILTSGSQRIVKKMVLLK